MKLMKRTIFFLCLLVVAVSCSRSNVRDGSGPVAKNPLTMTDIPDNDVIRVGEDYYMISTTMYFCPGAPIMHSRDLVHWRTVSYVFDTLEDDDVYNLRGHRNAYGAGQWAASLRYHDGVFYVLFVANDQKKSYVYRTRDIIAGPWERTVFDDWFFHDPSLLFDDDGRTWVVWGNGDLRLVELSADASSVIGEEKIIIQAPDEGWGLRAEGAHFYHIGQYYYIIEIDWPDGELRQVTCWRSKNIEGPYESKVVLDGALSNRPADGIAQGPVFDTQFGDWYAIQFQDHGALGRIPTLQPVTWVDGWPVMGDEGKPLAEVKVNLPDSLEEDYVWASDEFDTPSLPLVWQWNHKAPDDWSLSERPGWLRLRAHPALGIADARGSLTQRTVGPRCKSEVKMDVSSLAPCSEAGICAFQNRSGRIGVYVAEDGTRKVVVRRRESVQFEAPFEGDEICLRIDYVFVPELGKKHLDTATFQYSLDGGATWQDSGFTLNMKYTLDYFTGYRSALYCFGSGGSADFDWFHQYVY